MQMKERLIIISPRQYGYQTDYLKYVEYLPDKYNIIFICLDQKENRFECHNADIRYIRLIGKHISYLWFITYTYIYILFHSGKVMTSNFKGCRFLKKFLPWRKMVINIRTVSVETDPYKAKEQNARIRQDALPFDRIIMISIGGAKQLHLPMDKVDVVGLGADVISDTHKKYNPIHLLYVGTMNHRDIPKTVKGFHHYLHISSDVSATYDIIGDGDELQEIQDYVLSNNLQNQIFIHGRKRYDELKPYFDKCNIGVAFVPINEAYCYQPPTKTYEYINSGLFVIATRNKVHEETVHKDSGILINDTEEDFCNAILKIHHLHIDDIHVRRRGTPFLWKTIIMNELVTSLEKI